MLLSSAAVASPNCVQSSSINFLCTWLLYTLVQHVLAALNHSNVQQQRLLCASFPQPRAMESYSQIENATNILASRQTARLLIILVRTCFLYHLRLRRRSTKCRERRRLPVSVQPRKRFLQCMVSKQLQQSTTRVSLLATIGPTFIILEPNHPSLRSLPYKHSLSTLNIPNSTLLCDGHFDCSFCLHLLQQDVPIKLYATQEPRNNGLISRQAHRKAIQI